MERDLLYKEEVYAIIGAAMEVYNHLGSGYLEAVYEEAMIIESKIRNIPCAIQVRLPIQYKGQKLSKEYIADYIGYECVIAEFKCSDRLTSYDEAQLINYLKITGMKVGLLINFGNRSKLEWKRFVY